MSRGEKRRPTPHLGALLHERNRYKESPPDFYSLGKQYPSLKPYLRNVDASKHHAALAWDDPHAVRELTRTLLLHDFGLDWTIPIDRLCPPLPNRLNYLHWIEDLLQKANIDPFQGESEKRIYGIDVGTGANCIYALLGAKMNGWSFIATEIDEKSFTAALANVQRNALENQITVKRTSTNDLLSEPLADVPASELFDFVMCNPPFFEDMSEADTNPESCCMGSANEMVFPGGEVAFISRMIDDSLALQDRVLWFTSLIGRKSSLRKLLLYLRENKVPTMCSTEFFQGRTKRWGIAWTFRTDMKLDHTTKVLGKRKEATRRQELSFEIMPSTEQTGSQSLPVSIDEIEKRLHEYVESDEFCALAKISRPHEVATGSPPSVEQAHGISYAFKRLCRDGESTVFLANIEIRKSTENPKRFHVSIVYSEGDRSTFWKVADTLKVAILRTGRKWRRASK